MKKLVFPVLVVFVLLALSGCALFGAGGDEAAGEGAAASATPPPTWTPVTLAPTLSVGTMAPPTLTPSPTGQVTATEAPAETPTPEAGSQGPTPLPEPTEIAVMTPTPATPEPGSAVAGPNLLISPQMGEPRDIVLVTVSGFPPSSAVGFYWEPECRLPQTQVYYEDQTNAQGTLEFGLIVLPAERWPAAPPEEGDAIWLVANSDMGDGLYRCIEFLYLKRFDAGTSLVLAYTNEDYGYSIMLPNAWEWSWVEDDTSDVRFNAPSGPAKGFVRVISGTDVAAIIPGVMSAEVPGQTYSTANVSIGAYPGTQAAAANGVIVLFIPSNGRIYVISFTDASGQPENNIMASLRLK
jgi:hypothetical protein